MMKINTLFLTLALLPSSAFAQIHSASLWHDIAAKNTQTSNAIQQRRLMLDEAQLLTLIQSATDTQSPLILSTPLPNGENAEITLEPTNILSAELAQQYPQFKTWRVSSKHENIHSGRAEYTPRGLSIMLRGHNGEQWLIEQAYTSPGHAQQYQSYSKSQAVQHSKNGTSFSCNMQGQTETHPSPLHTQLIQQNPTADWTSKQENFAQRAGKILMSYDLAISATGEYTAKFGGSQTAAYSAIVSTVNRINDIYERELGITFKLVSGTETVFNNPDTDPFDDTSASFITFKNQQVLDSLIGSNRYDVGHVLHAGSGNNGTAHLNSVCNNVSKAQGFSASNNPLDSSFMVDYVAHELGHQMGATHTFNSERAGCGGRNRIASTAFEPGSGSTIMSYAGLCANDNIQNHVDPQFHSGSIRQIHALVFDGSANFCANKSSVSNSLPIVNAGNDHTIPARTPFILSGTATDLDGDTLLYSWDQMDAGNSSILGIDTANNALIKSNPLSSNGMRHVPKIASLISTTQTNKSSESLPRSNRKLSFRLSVRDGKGANGYDDIRLNVHDTGANFSISAPTDSLNPGRHTVRWQVADTDQPPINCANVDIAYTNNQGTTFTNLVTNTPNNGSATIQLSTQAQHIRVKCSNNIFFALSGTTPYVAAYRNDTNQPTLPEPTENTGENATDSSGGGALSLYLLHLLLLCGIFATFMRLRDKEDFPKVT